MSRNKDYQRLLNSRRWQELRAIKLKRNPLCEMCLQDGYITGAVDVHHIQPVESARNGGIKEMEMLCFSLDNLMSLCIPCHIKVHKEARSHTLEGHRQREDDRLKRWIDKHTVQSDK